MNARSVRALLSGNPVAQVFSFLVAGVVLIGVILTGAVVLAFVLAVGVIVAIYFWIRIRWRLRGAIRANRSGADARPEASTQAPGRRAGQGRIIDAESTVIEEREWRD